VSAGAGGLNQAYGIKFAPDGNLYDCSTGSNQILKYEGPNRPDGVQPGQFLAVFANTAHAAPFNFDFGPDGNVYVSCPEGVNNGAPTDSFIDRYYGPSSLLAGQFIGTFVANGTGGLNDSRTPLFDSQGNLYVADDHLNEVLEFQGPNGANPGAYIQAYVTTGQGGLAAPNGMDIGPDGNLYVSSRDANQVTRYAPSGQASFAVTLDSASTSLISVSYSTADGTAVAGSDYVATSGTLSFAPGETTHTIVVRTLDDTISEPTETFFVNLSNPVGATIARAQGVGTILDNEPLQVSSAKINSGAAQRSRVTDITVAFTGLASMPANPVDAFRLTRLNPDGSTADVTLAVDPSASTATQTIARLTFGGGLTEFGSLVDGLYRLTILATQVSGSGQPLDGDANGTAGGDFTLDLHRLYGDVNGDKSVNITDLTAFRNAFGSVTTDANYSPFLDFNGDGVINITDLTQFRNRFGVILP
jgi:sugar lactone lactonase YvrE